MAVQRMNGKWHLTVNEAKVQNLRLAVDDERLTPETRDLARRTLKNFEALSSRGLASID